MRRPIVSVALLTASSLLIGPVVAPSVAVAEARTPASDAAAAMLSFSDHLGQLAGLEELSRPLPMVRRSPRELLRLDTVFGDTLKKALAETAAGRGATADDLKTALEAATTPAGTDGVGLQTRSVSVTRSEDGVLQIGLEVVVTGMRELPLDHVETELVQQVDAEDQERVVLALVGDASSAAQRVPVTTSLTGSFDLSFHPEGPPGARLRLDTPPVLQLAAKGATTAVDVPAVYGVADVAVTGKVAFDLQHRLAYADPDGVGGITQAEWTAVLPQDLTDVTALDAAGADIDVDLSLVRKVLRGEEAPGGAIAWKVEAPGSGPTSAPAAVVDDVLRPFRNVTATQLLSGVGLFATALQAAGSSADAPLPYSSATLGEAFAPAAALQSLVQRQSDAQIVCGKTDTSPRASRRCLVTPGTARRTPPRTRPRAR